MHIPVILGLIAGLGVTGPTDDGLVPPKLGQMKYLLFVSRLCQRCYGDRT